MSSCPSKINPNIYPPKGGTIGMLADVLVPYAGTQETCPLHSEGSITQWCYSNAVKTDAGIQPFTTKNGATVNNIIGIDKNSFISVQTSGDQFYLTQPLDNLGISEIEFIIAPPDSNGHAQCPNFPYTPKDCTIPVGDCTTRCLYDGSMPCLSGLSPVKIGPCLTHPDWNGWSMQGFQCVPEKWGCDYTTGKCVSQAGGAYNDETACQASNTCMVCPPGFDTVTGIGSKSGCYRAQYTAQNCCDPGNHSCPCKNNWGGGYLGCWGSADTNADACGPELKWYGRCGSSWDTDNQNYCNDVLHAPFGAYQCTSSGYVQCTNPEGCAPPPEINIKYASGCILPDGSKIVRSAQNDFRWVEPFVNTL